MLRVHLIQQNVEPLRRDDPAIEVGLEASSRSQPPVEGLGRAPVARTRHVWLEIIGRRADYRDDPVRDAFIVETGVVAPLKLLDRPLGGWSVLADLFLSGRAQVI